MNKFIKKVGINLHKFIFEEFINGREITVGIINNKVYYDFTLETDKDPIILENISKGYSICYNKKYNTIQEKYLLLPYTGKLRAITSYKIKELQGKMSKNKISKMEDFKGKNGNYISLTTISKIWNNNYGL